MTDSDRVLALHDALVAEAKAVGLDSLLKAHSRLRSFPVIERPSGSRSRYTSPGYWTEWREKVSRGVGVSENQSDALRLKVNRPSAAVREIQDTCRPRRRKGLPRIGYRATPVRELTQVRWPTLPLNAVEPPVRLKGSVAMALMTPRSIFSEGRSPLTDLTTIPAKRIPGGSFAKSARFHRMPKQQSHNVFLKESSSTGRYYSQNMKFSTSQRFPTDRGGDGTVGPGSYEIIGQFDTANPREERFREILAELKEQEIRNNLSKTKAVERKMVLTPNWLHEAAMLNDVVKIESQSLLKSYEVNINFNDRLHPHGYTALHIASLYNHPQVVYLLVRERLPRFAELSSNLKSRPPSRYSRQIEEIDLDVQDQEGNTPLHLAAAEGFLEIVTMLCEADARVDVVNNCGKTALDVSKDQRIYQEIMIAFQRANLKEKLARLELTHNETPQSSNSVEHTVPDESTYPESKVPVLKEHSYFVGYDPESEIGKVDSCESENDEIW